MEFSATQEYAKKYYNFVKVSVRNRKYFSCKTLFLIHPFKGRVGGDTFHKTVMRSSAFVKWILVRFYEMNCK